MEREEREAIKRAFALREANFPSEIHFFAPSMVRYEVEGFSNRDLPRFPGVSVTGPACGLRCDHCNGKLLETMIAATTPEALWEVALRLERQGASGMLLSGGANRCGQVELRRFFPVVERIHGELSLQVVVHTGLVDRETAQAMARAGVQAAMLDIIGSEETIRAVYHLEGIGVEAYIKSLEELLAAGLAVAPHLVLGLDYGRLVGERQAMAWMESMPLASLVLVVFRPMSGTAMERVRPLPLEKTRSFFLEARQRFPQTPLLVGCARPFGPYRQDLDRFAVRCGFNGIAYPDESALLEARALGLKTRFSGDCCSLIYRDFL